MLSLLYQQGLHIAGISLVFGVLLRLYQGLFNPLAKVPGPWYTNWTSLPEKYYGITRRGPVWVHSLHHKYGPIVRTAPGRVYVSDPAAAQQIYRIKGEFRKADWYRIFIPGVPNIISSTEPETHRRLRRLLSGPLSESALRAVVPQVERKVRLAVQRAGEEMASRGAADMCKWWLFMATDVIGELSFGESFRMLEYQKMNQYVTDLQAIGTTSFLRATFPVVRKLGRYVPIPQVRNAQAIVPRMLSYARQSIERHKTLVDSGDANVSATLFQKVYKAGEDGSMTLEEVVANARTYIIAGSDTTANTLTWLTWAVCRDRGIRDRLAAEVAALPPDFADDDARRLPYLGWVIEETLRLYPAAPAGLPRAVPPGGAALAGAGERWRCWLPGGATVLTQAYSLHRDPAAFPDPETFDPSRWASPTQAMRDSFMPFGGGSRVCLGLHLAYIEMRMAVARFFRAFPNATVSSLEGMCDEDMIPDAFFLSSPRGHRCLIQAS